MSAAVIGVGDGEYRSWTLVYAAGRAGIRVGMGHVSWWKAPQTDNPKAADCLTVQTPDGVPVRVTADHRFWFSREHLSSKSLSTRRAAANTCRWATARRSRRWRS